MSHIILYTQGMGLKGALVGSEVITLIDTLGNIRVVGTSEARAGVAPPRTPVRFFDQP